MLCRIQSYNLDQVLESIKDTPTFSKTIDVLTKEWDTGSKTIISENPEIIGIINTHMENGVYAKVNAVLQREKALGKLNGVSDVDAYNKLLSICSKRVFCKVMDSNQQYRVNQ